MFVKFKSYFAIINKLAVVIKVLTLLYIFDRLNLKLNCIIDFQDFYIR